MSLSVFYVGCGSEKVPQVRYFRNFSTHFKKQRIKWKLITSTSHWEKISTFFQDCQLFTKKRSFLTSLFSKCFLPITLFDFISRNNVSNESLSLQLLIEKKFQLFSILSAFHKKKVFFDVTFFQIFSINNFVRFQQMRSQMKFYDALHPL